jgi:hypothetical protein
MSSRVGVKKETRMGRFNRVTLGVLFLIGISLTGCQQLMGAITGAFQILWIYYGSLIASRPVIIWNLVAVLINFLTVGAYAYFLCTERQAHTAPANTSTAA